MFKFFAKLTNFVSNLITPWQKLEISNANVAQLCPADLSDEQKRQWLGAYLAKCPSEPLPSLLLWANSSHQLNACYIRAGRTFHQCLPHLQVNAQTRRISQAGENIATIKPIIEGLRTQDNEVPTKFHLPTMDHLIAHKDQIYVDHKRITKEMVERSKGKARQDKTNFEACDQCSICLEKYTDENPPVLIDNTSSVYHAECIKEHWGRQFQATGQCLDPITNTSIVLDIPRQSNRANIHKAIEPYLIIDKAYLKTLRYCHELAGQVEYNLALLTVLVEENQALQKKIDEAAAAKTKTGPAIIHKGPASAGSSSKATANEGRKDTASASAGSSTQMVSPPSQGSKPAMAALKK